MNVPSLHSKLLAFLLVAMTTPLWPPSSALAHCDSVDGPIVPSALRALETGDPEPILRWVTPEHEDAVREAFVRARGVLEQGGEARELAELWFLETLIRVHREGEGEAYTGLKPAGSIEPIYMRADTALDEGTVESLSDGIAAAVREQIKERFERALQERAHADESVEAGRTYVAAYVDYMHFVERLDQLLGHHAGAEPVEAEHGHGR